MESPAGNTYAERNEILSQIGFKDYASYLASPLWKSIAVAIRSRPCIGCNGKACQVHHCSYSKETLLGTSRNKLVAICRTCHETIEFDGQRKRSLREANEALRVLVMSRSKKATKQKHKKRKANKVKFQKPVLLKRGASTPAKEEAKRIKALAGLPKKSTHKKKPLPPRLKLNKRRIIQGKVAEWNKAIELASQGGLRVAV